MLHINVLNVEKLIICIGGNNMSFFEKLTKIFMEEKEVVTVDVSKPSGPGYKEMSYRNNTTELLSISGDKNHGKTGFFIPYGTVLYPVDGGYVVEIIKEYF